MEIFSPCPHFHFLALLTWALVESEGWLAAPQKVFTPFAAGFTP